METKKCSRCNKEQIVELFMTTNSGKRTKDVCIDCYADEFLEREQTRGSEK